jgi:hypothetical protein
MNGTDQHPKTNHKKSNSITENLVQLKNSTLEQFNENSSQKQRKSMNLKGIYLIKPKSIKKSKKQKVELYPINYLPSLTSPNSTIYNSPNFAGKTCTTINTSEQPPKLNIYNKVFDKNFEKMIKYNKYENTKELFLIHPEKHEIPVIKENIFENKLKQIKTKVAFIKSIYDYSFPVVMKDKMKSLREIYKTKQRANEIDNYSTIQTLPIDEVELKLYKRKSVISGYLGSDRRKETTAGVNVCQVNELSNNNYRVFKLVNV